MELVIKPAVHINQILSMSVLCSSQPSCFKHRFYKVPELFFLCVCQIVFGGFCVHSLFCLVINSP